MKSAKRYISLLLVIFFMSSVSPVSHAALPENGIEKSSYSSASTDIDKSRYVDGTAYENEPAEVEFVKIGLKYDTGAVYSAALENPNGNFFETGYLDENRVFHATGKVSSDIIVISRQAAGEKWHILLDGKYESELAADNAAAAFGGYVQQIDGEYRVLYGSFGSKNAAEETKARFRLNGVAYTEQGEAYLISDADGNILQHIKSEDSLAVRAGNSETTKYDGRNYRGIFIFIPAENDRMTVINCLALEDYVKGVIPYEMSPSWPYEALRAQAVCARTFVVFNQNSYAEYGFDLTDDTESQVYMGTDGADKTTDSAVDTTAGQYVRYRGEICDIYYFAADGGATEDGKNFNGVDVPYLSGKTDPFEDAVNYTGRDWNIERDGYELSWLLSQKGFSLGEISELEPEYSYNGNVIAMTFIDRDGRRLRLEGRDCYTFIGLNNCRFTVEEKWGTFYFRGDGWGHNCGMSQWGAYAMADVYGYNYEDIIRFYFTGAYIA